jgi:hypothetical protein
MNSTVNPSMAQQGMQQTANPVYRQQAAQPQARSTVKEKGISIPDFLQKK